jgi:hypothetical protein
LGLDDILLSLLEICPLQISPSPPWRFLATILLDPTKISQIKEIGMKHKLFLFFATLYFQKLIVVFHKYPPNLLRKKLKIYGHFKKISDMQNDL